MSNRLAVTPQYLLPKRVLTELAGKFANLRGGALTHAVIRKFVAHYGVDMAEAADSAHRELRHLQRFLHPAAARGRAADRRRAVRLPGGRGHQPVRPDRARPDLPGQGPQLFDARAGGRRPGAGAPVRPRPLRHALPGAQGLPPHPHALRGPPDAHDLRARATCSRSTRSRRATCPACSRATSAWSACSTRRYGPFVNVLVGATIVGSVATVWHGVVNPPRTRDIREWRYDGPEHRAAPRARRWAGSCSAPPSSCCSRGTC